MLIRAEPLVRIRRALRRSRVVALVGPRQCGKTTLAREIVAPASANYFDLEDTVSVERLAQPRTALASLRGVVVIDEIQHRPELFSILRVLADRKPLPARFLVLGSASPDLLRQSSESLAGRIEVVDLGGFSLREVGSVVLRRHWVRGAFPQAFLARSEANSFNWRRQFVKTFIERDVPRFGINIAAPALLRFWNMIAHVHGGIWQAADPARSLGVSEPTVRRYLDVLSSLYMVRQLQPWHENLTKRQVKAPKVYVRDSGLLHALLGINTERLLLTHPKCGASWEGYVIEEVLKVIEADEFYFWATHQGAELDLLLIRNGRRVGVEVKYVDAPKLTPSMRTALADLKLDRLWVIYPGTTRYAIAPGVEAVPAATLADRSIRQIWRAPGPRKNRD